MILRYISTRGTAPVLSFDEVLLAGLARDGGLYLPESWPEFSADRIKALRGLSYVEQGVRIMTPFLGGTIKEADFADLLTKAYAGFDHKAVAPLVQLADNEFLLELFHGPTLAFKDLALQVLGQLFDHLLAKRGERVTIVGATSGDTGSAAIEACRDRAAIDIVILHPHNRVSEVQRRQMTTVDAANVHNVAIEGTFDDCQDIVKALFNDLAFRDEMRLSAVNSINWARIMAQIVYYFSSAVSVGAPDRAVSFAVPTGNFGNVFAGYAARAMGLPIKQLIIGSNRNDILARFFDSGTMSIGEVQPSLSPSMDIQVSSNFERFLYYLLHKDGKAVSAMMESFRRDGKLSVAPAHWRMASAIFAAYRLDDSGTKRAIARLYAETGQLIDPHSAVGVMAGREKRRDPAVPLIALATAHPAKFPDAVKGATRIHPALPPRMSDLFSRPERYSVLPNNVEAVREHVRQAASR
jgi:threonine synthase